MNAVQKIKAAAAKLKPDEQVELFRWWVESDVFKQRQLASLKREIAIGVADLERGRYRTYNEANVMQLAEEVGRSGRERLAKFRKSPRHEPIPGFGTSRDRTWMKSGITLHKITRRQRTNSCAPSSPGFLSSRPCLKWGGNARNWPPGCEVFPLAATSSFTVPCKMASESRACCMVRGIFRRCLNEPHISALEANPSQCLQQVRRDG